MKQTFVFVAAFALMVAFAGTAYARSDVRPRAAASAESIACLGTAVAARESAIGSAWSDFSSAMTSAYAARGSALAGAYAKSNPAEVKTAVKAAWKAFKETA